MTDDTDEIARLKAAMWKKTFFLMEREMKDGARLAGATLDHYRWMIGEEKRGRVFLSGPTFALDGTPTGGMTVLRVASEAEAHSVAAADPFVASGAVGYRLRTWQVNEGSLTLRVDLSDMTGHPE